MNGKEIGVTGCVMRAVAWSSRMALLEERKLDFDRLVYPHPLRLGCGPREASEILGLEARSVPMSLTVCFRRRMVTGEGLGRAKVGRCYF